MKKTAQCAVFFCCSKDNREGHHCLVRTISKALFTRETTLMGWTGLGMKSRKPDSSAFCSSSPLALEVSRMIGIAAVAGFPCIAAFMA